MGKVQVWKDAQVLGLSSSLQTYLQESKVEPNMQVKDLILEGVEKWDIDKILEVFLSIRATKILSIVILPTKQPDKLIWGFEKSDKFNVRSSYKLILDKHDLIIGESPNSTHLKLYQKALWKAFVPSKIRIMAWRVCHECLSTIRQLLQKGSLQMILAECVRKKAKTRLIQYSDAIAYGCIGNTFFPCSILLQDLQPSCQHLQKFLKNSASQVWMLCSLIHGACGIGKTNGCMKMSEFI